MADEDRQTPTPPRDGGTPAPRTMTASALDRMIVRAGTARNLIRELLGEVDTLREQATTGATLPAGQVAVPQADVDALAAFRALRLEPAAITAAVTERDTLAGRLRDMEGAGDLAAAAKAAGVPNVKLLQLAAKDAGVRVAMRDVAERKGDATVTRRMAVVITKDGDKDVVTPLATYHAEHWADLFPIGRRAAAAAAARDAAEDDDDLFGTDGSSDDEDGSDAGLDGEDSEQDEDAAADMAVGRGGAPRSYPAVQRGGLGADRRSSGARSAEGAALGTALGRYAIPGQKSAKAS